MNLVACIAALSRDQRFCIVGVTSQFLGAYDARSGCVLGSKGFHVVLSLFGKIVKTDDDTLSFMQIDVCRDVCLVICAGMRKHAQVLSHQFHPLLSLHAIRDVDNVRRVACLVVHRHGDKTCLRGLISSGGRFFLSS